MNLFLRFLSSHRSMIAVATGSLSVQTFGQIAQHYWSTKPVEFLSLYLFTTLLFWLLLAMSFSTKRQRG